MDVRAVKPMEGFSTTNIQPERVASISPVEKGPVKTGTEKEDKKQPNQELSEQQLSQISQQLSKFMEEMNAGIQFTVHQKTNSLMVQVIDSKNQKVLKEFPSKEFLDTVANIREYVGFLLDKKV